MRATARWALADLRTHRGQALSITLATAGIVVALLMSVALLEYAANPWQRLFTSTQGAHVWLRTTDDANTTSLAGLDGVEALSGPFSTVNVTARHGGEKAVLGLRAIPGAGEPKVARPALKSGRWLDGSAQDGVVLEQSVAAALWVQPGDYLRVTDGTGHDRDLRVVGVAETAEPRFTGGGPPGIGWAPPQAVSGLGAGKNSVGQTVGLRLKDPGDTDFIVQRAVEAAGSDHVVSVSTWRDARSDAEGDNRLLGLLLGIFGLGALLAAAVAVTGGVGSRVLAQVRDISILKAVGFTPGQVARMFLIQHAFLAVLGVACGVASTQALGTRLPGPIGEAMKLWQALPEHRWTLAYTCLSTVAAIAAATVLAAWRAGRVPPIPAARTAAPGRHRMSRTARLALRLRTPAVLVLGWRGVSHRSARSTASVARLTLPLLMITVALGTLATLDRFTNAPEQVGLAGQLSVRADGPDQTGLEPLLTRQPGVAAAYPATEVAALAPGQSRMITLRGVGTSQRQYPFAAVEGRAATGLHEAMAGQGLLDTLHVSVGQWVRVTVGGTPQILHLVGRTIEPEHNGVVISTSLDTLQEQDRTLRAQFYELRLRPGADPSAVRTALLAGHSGLEIRKVPNPAEDLLPIRGVVAGLIAVLVLIGLVELSTVISATVREHGRDLRAYRSIGLTPRQTVAIVTTSTGLIALAAAAVGTVLGVVASNWLINLQGRSSGIGAGIARSPSAGSLAMTAGAAIAIAVAASVLPAAKAAHRTSLAGMDLR
ncbi:ABC transporter permease [Streptomyces sp. H10-C2]|uniref:ABC transporter permease n=1 Tax=unclassified Streptomyces TaxID=2593676 RepID=UPI0024BA6938|nr:MULTISPECIES: FtsX-like permease family protein [unclassified Streptomyces]MDJ0340974.1 ABC transporter permease [Streptomyces sp. PH10-H1]MDJ0369794.1 ABC transporter permease [Streptomyces sp. H10-C2]